MLAAGLLLTAAAFACSQLLAATASACSLLVFCCWPPLYLLARNCWPWLALSYWATAAGHDSLCLLATADHRCWSRLPLLARCCWPAAGRRCICMLATAGRRCICLLAGAGHCVLVLDAHPWCSPAGTAAATRAGGLFVAVTVLVVTCRARSRKARERSTVGRCGELSLQHQPARAVDIRWAGPPTGNLDELPDPRQANLWTPSNIEVLSGRVCVSRSNNVTAPWQPAGSSITLPRSAQAVVPTGWHAV